MKGRAAEVLIVAIGLALRVSMFWTYDPRIGYDAADHLAYIEWMRTHWSLPPLMLSRETYYPPLYYVIAGAFGRLNGGDVSRYGLPSVFFSCATLLLLWAGIARALPGRRLTVIAALALAAVLPDAVHISGMMYCEALNCLLALVALMLASKLLARQRLGRSAGRLPFALGLMLGLEMLTKISALVTMSAIATAIAADLVLRAGPRRDLLRRLAPWAMAFGVIAATAGWNLVRNHNHYGKAIVTGFDGLDGPPPAEIERMPYWQRRAPSFFYGWSNDIFVNPHYPAGVQPTSYFWPVLVASTFVDYYHYYYVPAPREPSPVKANGRDTRPGSLPFARASAIGGTVIAASTAVAWLWVLIICVRRRSCEWLPFLIVPAFAILGQLLFVVRYPFDYQGPIKGIYIQFAAAPLFALFGLAVEATARRRLTRPIAVVQALSVLAVAAYTFYARVIAVIAA